MIARHGDLGKLNLKTQILAPVKVYGIILRLFYRTVQLIRRTDMDYKSAGVDIEAGYRSVELIKDYVKATNRHSVRPREQHRIFHILYIL